MRIQCIGTYNIIALTHRYDQHFLQGRNISLSGSANPRSDYTFFVGWSWSALCETGPRVQLSIPMIKILWREHLLKEKIKKKSFNHKCSLDCVESLFYVIKWIIHEYNPINNLFWSTGGTGIRLKTSNTYQLMVQWNDKITWYSMQKRQYSFAVNFVDHCLGFYAVSTACQ